MYSHSLRTKSPASSASSTLITDDPVEAPVPPVHSYKFISELQRVCGARERSNPILIHMPAEDTWADDLQLTQEEKRLQLVTRMLCFLARHIEADFVDEKEDEDSEKE